MGVPGWVWEQQRFLALQQTGFSLPQQYPRSLQAMGLSPAQVTLAEAKATRSVNDATRRRMFDFCERECVHACTASAMRSDVRPTWSEFLGAILGSR